MSSLTNKKPFKKKNNKVEKFLHKWKHSKNKKTNLYNTLNKQNTYKETITHFQQSINSSISLLSIRETCDNNIPSNQPSLKSTSTTLAKDPNSKSSYNTNYSPDVSPTYQPIISNTSRINAYIHNNKTKRILTFDRTIVPKRKILTPTKPHVLTTKQDSLTTFGFRANVATPLNHIQAPPIDTTLQPPIQHIEPFDTNEFKGDKMNCIDPNHI